MFTCAVWVCVQTEDFVIAKLKDTNKAKKLKGFEAIKGVILEEEVRNPSLHT